MVLQACNSMEDRFDDPLHQVSETISERRRQGTLSGEKGYVYIQASEFSTSSCRAHRARTLRSWTRQYLRACSNAHGPILGQPINPIPCSGRRAQYQGPLDVPENPRTNAPSDTSSVSTTTSDYQRLPRNYLRKSSHFCLSVFKLLGSLRRRGLTGDRDHQRIPGHVHMQTKLLIQIRHSPTVIQPTWMVHWGQRLSRCATKCDMLPRNGGNETHGTWASIGCR